MNPLERLSSSTAEVGCAGKEETDMKEQKRRTFMKSQKWLLAGLCASVLLPGAVVRAQEVMQGAARGATIGVIGGAIGGDAGKGAAAGAAAGAMVGGMRKYDKATGTENQGGVVRGGARGAAVGAVAGAIAGDAGKGAAIGAVSGGLIGGMRKASRGGY
jgi:hypothetical protein